MGLSSYRLNAFIAVTDMARAESSTRESSVYRWYGPTLTEARSMRRAVSSR